MKFFRIFLSFIFLFAFACETRAQAVVESSAATLIEAGQYDEAIRILEVNADLYKTDTAYEKQFTWLVNLYLLKKDWNKMIAFYKGRTFQQGEDTSLLSAARFYARNPREQLSVSTHKAIKYKPSMTGTPMVEVTINGKKYRFWVDTGAGLTVISSKVANAVKVKQHIQETATATAATGNAVAIQYGLIDELNFANVSVKNHACLVIDKKALEFKIAGLKVLKIDGIIGWNLLQELGVTIDFGNKHIWFESTEQAKPVSNPNFYWMEEPLVKCSLGNGKDAIFFIDTGASEAGVYENIYSKVDAALGVKKELSIGSAGGTRKIITLSFPELEVKVKNQSVLLKDVHTQPITKEGEFAPDGVFGVKEIKNMVLTFNLKQGTFSLEPSPKM